MSSEYKGYLETQEHSKKCHKITSVDQQERYDIMKTDQKRIPFNFELAKKISEGKVAGKIVNYHGQEVKLEMRDSFNEEEFSVSILPGVSNLHYHHYSKCTDELKLFIELPKDTILFEEGHEVHVSLDTAILLKKAGFNWGCSRNSIFYPEDGFEDCSEGYYAPRLDLAQKWLREVKGYHIIVEYDGYQRLYQCRLDSYAHMYDLKNREWVNENDGFSTYEDALYAGIQRALELILEKGE